jgi:hypothetical protein
VGIVDDQKQKFADVSHALMYVSKYLVKRADREYPAWVMESRRRIRFVGSSRAVGALVRPGQCRRVPDVVCDGEGTDTALEAAEEGERDRVLSGGLSYAERVAACGRRSVIMQEMVRGATGEVWYRFVERVAASQEEVVSMCGGEVEDVVVDGVHGPFVVTEYRIPETSVRTIPERLRNGSLEPRERRQSSGNRTSGVPGVGVCQGITCAEANDGFGFPLDGRAPEVDFKPSGGEGGLEEVGESSACGVDTEAGGTV